MLCGSLGDSVATLLGVAVGTRCAGRVDAEPPARTGGYGASAATALLGVFEAAWHPNRQTIHDRIADTVVVRRRKVGRG
ncbi:MAG: hypothetical protein R6X25_08525 [Candidatus Krumholzibacteriia bacterium]